MSGHATHGRLDAWLRRCAKGKDCEVVRLVVEAVDGEPQIVGTWALSDLINADGAQLVLDVAQEYTDGLGARSRFHVQVCTREERILFTKSINNVHPSEDSEPESGFAPQPGTAKVEDSTQAGIVAQCMRHNEVLIRMYTSSMGGVLQKALQVLELQSQQIKELSAKVRRQERDDSGEVETAEDQAKAETITRIGEAITTHLIPHIAQNLNANGRGPQ